MTLIGDSCDPAFVPPSNSEALLAPTWVPFTRKIGSLLQPTQLMFVTAFTVAVLPIADQVVAGTASEHAQPETGAGYEGIIGEAEARINWASHIDITYNLIRGCNPAPGAWTTQEGRKLILFDCEKLTAGTFTKVKGQRIGEIVAADGKTITIHGQGGFIVVQRLKLEGGQKIPAGDAGLHVGTLLA